MSARDTPGVSSAFKVYPRVYGETGLAVILPHRRQGLSPRVRGNHPIGVEMATLQDWVYPRVYGETASVLQGLSGSIPACTGKPRWPCRPSSKTSVYPRVYGETAARLASPPRIAVYLSIARVYRPVVARVIEPPCGPVDGLLSPLGLRVNHLLSVEQGPVG